MTKKILTTTGLVLPDSELFEMYQDKQSSFDSFVGRANNYTLNTLAAYYSTNKVSYSPQADMVYARYQSDKSHANFVAMVDFMANVLSSVDCKTFMEWQAYNRHTPVITMSLCKDLLTGNIGQFDKYDNLTPYSRFIMNESITKELGKRRHDILMQGVNPVDVSWVNVLTPLMGKKDSFSTTFKYFFVNSF